MSDVIPIHTLSWLTEDRALLIENTALLIENRALYISL